MLLIGTGFIYLLDHLSVWMIVRVLFAALHYNPQHIVQYNSNLLPFIVPLVQEKKSKTAKEILDSEKLSRDPLTNFNNLWLKVFLTFGALWKEPNSITNSLN